ncbi:hypothetical protein KSF_091720 [Reticulibacter mediterranei]|uniref:YCII-related domain-containing protein n=1 Tax=Reticulibacter mediterranei TaxID=2778369 RepID=A0A8J3IWG0_9CHLR|nr:YciI family protein [Reticulibacter mediterranei]GHO99124.1 hypothetical protein KSF_091720 [Reticulibacter mediterranei]
MIFAVVYTPAPAWIQGKPVVEQPFFKEHARYMRRFFADGRLLMGGFFLDNQGGLGILEAADEAEAREIVEQDPAVQNKVFQPDLHPWYPAFNQYAQ